MYIQQELNMKGRLFFYASFVNKKRQDVCPKKSFLETKLAQPYEPLGHHFCVCHCHLLEGWSNS